MITTNVSVPYRILLPKWIFISSFTEEELINRTKEYLKRRYPDRIFIRVEGKYAICERKHGF